MTDTTFVGAPPAVPSLPALLNSTVVRRAAIVALVLGTVLTFANQAGAIFGTAPLQPLPLVLNFVTPFVVVTLSQLFGIRQAVLEAPIAPAAEPFLATVRGHGIPARALALGVIAGGFNGALMIAAALLAHGDLAAVSWAPLGPAFTLPVVFGLLSQALAYRRARFVYSAGRGA